MKTKFLSCFISLLTSYKEIYNELYSLIKNNITLGILR